MNKLNIVDMFCGGGGESTGLIEAGERFLVSTVGIVRTNNVIK